MKSQQQVRTYAREWYARNRDDQRMKSNARMAKYRLIPFDPPEEP